MAKIVPVGDGIPPEFYRNAIDLNRFSNSVSKKLVTSYNNVMLKAVEKLKIIEGQPLNERPAYKTARLRALIKQTKQSLNSWANGSVDDLIVELEGVAKVQAGFVESQLKKSIPKGMAMKITDQIGYSVKSVAVSPSFAKSVVTTDPTAINLAVLQSDLAGITKDKKARTKGTFKLTAKQGQTITLPNGNTVKKSFLGIAQAEAKRLNQVVRSGLLSGDTTPEIVKELVGNLKKDQKGSLSQLLAQGGAATKSANNQVITIVRTTVNQVTNTASQSVYKANPDVTEEYRYIATLDSRTTPVCRDLDGQVFKYNQGPVPPQHFGCRSTTVAVVNYKKYGFTPPPAGKRASVGGPVPANTTYGKWLYGERAKGSKFKPGAEQIAALGEQKAKYFNRLANKYGPDQALKKLIREDNTEVSLAQLQKRYGKPEDIKAKVIKKKAAAPKVTTPPVKPKTAGFEKRLVDSNPEDLIKKGQELLDEVGGLDYKVVESLHRRFQLVRKADPTRFKKAMDIYIKGADKFEKKMEKVRQLMLKTDLSDIQVKQFVKDVKITTSFKTAEKKQLKGYLDEYIRMFNGNGFVKNKNGVPAISKIGKAQRGSCKFYEGSFTTDVGSLGTVNKGTTFHEITHAVEVANPKLNKWTTNWRNKKGFTSETKIKANMNNKNAYSVYGPSQQAGKPVYRLKDITKINYKNAEDALVNDYINPYMGKVYMKYDFSRFGIDAVDPTEVLTMSVENFDSASHMTKLFRKHPDLFKLIVGMSRASGL